MRQTGLPMPTKKPNGYALFVVDLDGILIGRDEQISARVFDAVSRVAKEITVSIATGREPADVMRFAGQLGLTAPQISNNGAMIIDPATGDSLWSVPMVHASARLVAGELHKMGTTFIATHTDGTITDAAQVGFGIAMAESPGEVKAAADHLAPSVDGES